MKRKTKHPARGALIFFIVIVAIFLLGVVNILKRHAQELQQYRKEQIELQQKVEGQNKKIQELEKQVSLKKQKAVLASTQKPRRQTKYVQQPDRSRLEELVRGRALQHSLDYRVAFAVIDQESGWNVNAVSPTSDCGMWQINMPSHPQITCDQAKDPEFATNWAVPHLKGLIDTYGLESGLAAYNAGTGGMKEGKGFGYAKQILTRIGSL